MDQANWQRNARALAAGNVLLNIGWNASFVFLPLIAEAPTTNEPSAFDMRATMTRPALWLKPSTRAPGLSGSTREIKR
jgi:hypothetical protein